MIDIKFRGIAIGLEEWKYGCLIKTRKNDGTLLYYIVDEANQQWLVHPETIGQYTGFKDMKDKDIYANDIIRRKWFRGKEAMYVEEVIQFDIGAFWCVRIGGCGGELLGRYLTTVTPSQIEVIRNLHSKVNS